MTAADLITKLAQELSEGGMVIKATLLYDFIDSEGDRRLQFAVTDDMTVWDLEGMLHGVASIVANKYRKGG